MTNNIFNYAIRKGEINREVLCEMCDQMDDNMRTRFVEAVLGIVNVPDIVAGIPKTRDDKYKGLCTFVAYNYLQDALTFTYKEKVTRYFSGEEKAEKYAETGRYSWNDCESKPTENCSIEAVHEFDRESTCCLSSWTSRD